MAGSATLYGDSLQYVNAVCESYIGENVAAVAQIVGPFAVTTLTLYVVLWGFASIRGLIKEPLSDFVSRVITISVVFAIGLNVATYNILITNTFLRGPDEFVAGLARSSGPNGVVNGLDAMLQQGLDLGGRFWAKAGILDGDFGLYFIAIFVFFTAIVVTAYAFFLLALSKVALTVLVGIGPLFFIGLLFQSTSGFFNSWLRQMANYFLVPILVVMVNLLVLKLFGRAASGAAAITNTAEVGQLLPFFAMGLVCVLALASVLGIAAGLAGGVSLSSFGLGRFSAGLLRHFGGKFAGWAGKKAWQGAKWSTKKGWNGAAWTSKKVARAAWNYHQRR